MFSRNPSFAVLAALALACGGGGGTPVDLDPEPFPGPGDYRRSVFAGDRDRFFEVHIPPGLDPADPVPLVLAFHGVPGTGETMRQISGLDPIADREGFVVVYPNSAVGEWALGCGGPCTRADRHGIEDLRFVLNLVEKMLRDAPIDESRIFVTGFSQGALFAHRVACTIDERFAAFASVAATMLDVHARGCAPSRPVPFLFFHGTEDREFPPGGRQGDFVTSIPLEETIDLWVERNRCSSDPAIEPQPDVEDDGTRVILERFGGCAGDAVVELWRVEGGGHTWPGSPANFSGALGRESQDVEASEVIVEFFLGR
ncbi:MAG: PHB depolymerase family esterase [Gemmatimonadota bacterium]|nr:PHB depolymerase family esterase [Gemmatimonadota bacterium]